TKVYCLCTQCFIFRVQRSSFKFTHFPIHSFTNFKKQKNRNFHCTTGNFCPSTRKLRNNHQDRHLLLGWFTYKYTLSRVASHKSLLCLRDSLYACSFGVTFIPCMIK